MTGFSEKLRAAHADAWDAIRTHPFTEELGRGTLPVHKMQRYLVQDHRFIDHFVRLLAAAVVAAPTLKDRIPGCQFLALVTGPENTYFERCFTALGVDDAQRFDAPDAPETTAFKDLMAQARTSESFATMVAVLVVAEWIYLEWATRVAPLKPKDFWFSEWIDLHTGDYFASVVAYLRGQLDAVEPTLSAKDRQAAAQAFGDAVRLEKAFFDMAYVDAEAR